MKTRDIVIGIIALVLLLLLFSRLTNNNEIEPVADDVQSGSVEKNLEETMHRDIPDDLEKIEFKNSDSQAVVTRDMDSSGTNISVLADMPDPGPDRYQVWISDDNSDPEFISLGVLSEAKGGYLLDAHTELDPDVYKKITISRETEIDSSIESIIFQGFFE